MPIPLSIQADLTILYSAPGRHYHTITHVQHCFRELDDFIDGMEALTQSNMSLKDFELLTWALWFHDVIYDPKRSNNEALSANLASFTMRQFGVPPDYVPLVCSLIRATKHGDTTTSDVASNSPQEDAVEAPEALKDLMVDIDLAILGSSPGEYKEYAEGIQKEYSWVPEENYKTARSAVLQNFLDQKRIFKTEYFFNKYEEHARENMKWEIAELRGDHDNLSPWD